MSVLPPGLGRRATARDVWRLSAGTFSRWPVPPPVALTGPVRAWTVALAPVTALVTALPAAVVAGMLLARTGSSELAALTLVAGLAATNRGLHLDGLADTADAFTLRHDRVRALAAMRDSASGPMAVAALVFTLSGQVLLVGSGLVGSGLAGSGLAGSGLVGSGLAGRGPGADLAELVARLTPVVLALASGRLAIGWLCRRGLPAARAEGLGAALAGTLGRGWLGAQFVVWCGFAAVALRLAAGVTWPAALGTALAVAGAAAGTAWWLGRQARGRFGGVTGDVLGAGVELAGTAALLALALVGA